MALFAVASGCGGQQGGGGVESLPETRVANGAESTLPDTAGVVGPDRSADSLIVVERLRRAREQRLDTLPTGALVGVLGRTFVGTPYVPQTLDPPGRERLIVNLRAFDCVTFIENVLALARTVQSGGGFPEFLGELERIRYRTGAVAGYPSRLHYFSEWIAANEQKGLLRDITRELGGIVDPERIGFMSANRGAYRQLADDSVLAEIRAMEESLAFRTRYYLPESRIPAVAERIEEGDIIAATSTLPGLDIAHTGIAVREGGRLHLMHAPLVGDSVEISARPLAERIQRIERQDGIMVARPR
ncbi:MAG TPA: N-acetylmuramoyl-L-alanine amidase-like domain-containing protein [Longimicrobiales bacterium]|nr:N-acetylmuramoyl-L-alanine amidase-like domain-containing protein [Longimicrobiales bacterium]